MSGAVRRASQHTSSYLTVYSLTCSWPSYCTASSASHSAWVDKGGAEPATLGCGSVTLGSHNRSLVLAYTWRGLSVRTQRTHLSRRASGQPRAKSRPLERWVAASAVLRARAIHAAAPARPRPPLQPSAGLPPAPLMPRRPPRAPRPRAAGSPPLIPIVVG